MSNKNPVDSSSKYYCKSCEGLFTHPVIDEKRVRDGAGGTERDVTQRCPSCGQRSTFAHINVESGEQRVENRRGSELGDRVKKAFDELESENDKDMWLMAHAAIRQMAAKDDNPKRRLKSLKRDIEKLVDVFDSLED